MHVFKKQILAGAVVAACALIAPQVASADVAYVANYGSNTVSVIDTWTDTVSPTTITVGAKPWGVAVSPDGTRAYVTNSGDDTVSVIDTSTNTVVATVPVGDNPQGVAVGPDGRVYVTNFSGGSVSVINPATNTVQATVTVGSGPYGVVVSPDGTRAYVTNAWDDTVSVINTATNTVVQTITRVGDTPYGIAITPDGTRLYVANVWDWDPVGRSNTVSVIDTATNTVIDKITVGWNPKTIAISPDGSRAYVANEGTSNVSVIDTAATSPNRDTVITTVPVGNYPEAGVAFTADGRYVYVTNTRGTVSAIDTTTNTVVATVTGVGPTPFGIAIAPAPADLAITKTDSPDPVTEGQDVTYTLSVTNNGPFAATNVKATDVLPQGTTFNPTGTSSSCTEAAGTVTCDFGELANEATETAEVVVTTSTAGSLSNTATVAGTVVDPVTSNNSSTATTQVNAVVLPALADLAITKTDSPDPVAAGADVTYTLSVTNNGPNAATDVKATDVLPEGTTFNAAASSEGCTEAAGTVTCDFRGVADDATETAEIVVTTSTAGSLSNTATVEGAEIDPTGSNDSSTATTTVDPPPTADLALTKTANPNPASAGQGLTYTVAVENRGPDAAPGVEITDDLPAGVSFVSASDGCSQASGKVTCDVGALASGANRAVEIVVTADRQGTVTNTASVSHRGRDGVASNNTASAEVVVNEAPPPAAEPTSFTRRQCSGAPTPTSEGRISPPGTREDSTDCPAETAEAEDDRPDRASEDEAGTQGERFQSGGDAAAAGDSGDGPDVLSSTGLNLALVALFGALALGSGVMLRRRDYPPR